MLRIYQFGRSSELMIKEKIKKQDLTLGLPCHVKLL